VLGTTHFTNAVMQRRGLAPTAAVRLGLPATEALPPMVDWPPELREAIGNRYYFAHGGHEFDGRVITPLDPDELRRIARDIAKRRIRTSRSPRYSVRSTRRSSVGQGRSSPPRCLAHISRCRATSAGSGFWSARTPPS
jgi:hypothetical protein